MVQMILSGPYQGLMSESREDIATLDELEWEKTPGRWAIQWEMNQMPMETRFQQDWGMLPSDPLLEGLTVERLRLMERLWQEMLEDNDQVLTPEVATAEQVQQMYQQMIPQVQAVELSAIELQNLRE